MTWCPGHPNFVVPPTSWGARFAPRYDPANGRQVVTPVQKLIVHHSASNQPPAGGEAAFSRQIESYGEGRDGAAIEYNFLVYPTGVLHGGFGDTRGCHCVAPDPATGRAFNSSSIGICFIGFFHPPRNDYPTPAAVDVFQRWLSWMTESGRLTDDVLTRASSKGQPGWYGHRDAGVTACPGDTLYPLLPSIIQIGSAPAPTPTPPPSGDDDMATPCGFIQCNAGTVGHHVDGSDYSCPVNGTTFRVNAGGTLQWVHSGELDDTKAVMAAAGQKTDTWSGAVAKPDVFGRLVGDKPR